MAKNAWISGFTTNPSLLKKASIANYVAYAHELVAAVPDRHISFEVISDDIPEMIAQARLISSWGKNVYANSGLDHEGRADVRRRARALARRHQDQHDRDLHDAAGREGRGRARWRHAVVSVFAGRLGDLGIDYRPIVLDAVARARTTKNVEIIWASTREVFNVIEAHDMGCHIITAPADVLNKLPAIGTQTGDDLALGAVKAFRTDALAAGITLPLPAGMRAAE